MTSALYQFAVELKLYFRNRMALLYGYLFPTIFLVAFWMLYRHESVPLVNHVGELLTVTALGGACFGLPTSMVSERERGVWRRYRLTPVSTFQIVLTTVAARYVILISAAVLQIALAMWIGMPAPDRPIELFVAFTLVSFAFLGLGLVIAMLADNVPAVQALGQSIFLPMLIIGGVAVRIESLPPWAQHLSAFFPGRYSVEALQSAVNGPGIAEASFSLLALLIVGAAACLAAGKLFRWDAKEQFVTRTGKAWTGVALAAWISIGLLAEVTGRIGPAGRMLTPGERTAYFDAENGLDGGGVTGDSPQAADHPDSLRSAAPEASTDGSRPAAVSADHPLAEEPPQEDRAAGETPSNESGAARTTDERTSAEAAEEHVATEAEAPAEAEEHVATDAEAPAEAEEHVATDAKGPASAEEHVATEAEDESAVDRPASWEKVEAAHVERYVVFDGLPSDKGLEAPIAGRDEPLYRDIEHLMNCIRATLPRWEPAAAEDPVQRARNVLYIAALPDMYQMSGTERFIPLVVFEHLRETFAHDRLIQILYWIAAHPDEGDISAAGRLKQVCLDLNAPDNVQMLQERTGWYAAKLLGRLTGHIEPR